MFSKTSTLKRAGCLPQETKSTSQAKLRRKKQPTKSKKKEEQMFVKNSLVFIIYVFNEILVREVPVWPPLRFFDFSDFYIWDQMNVGRSEMDNTEWRKQLNKQAIIKKRTKKQATSHNLKRQGGCVQIQWHVIWQVQIKKISVQYDERKHQKEMKKNYSKARAWMLSSRQSVEPKQ